MGENYNYQSRNTIKQWHEKAAELSGDDFNTFDKFIFLWISFNGYFVSKYFNEAQELSNRREPSEWQYIKIISKNNAYKKVYVKLIENDPNFNEELNNFKGLLKNTHFPGKIADLRPNSLIEDLAKEFSDIHNFEQFILITYQIRCNLFHGNKRPDYDGDIKIVKGIFEPFMIFITEIYRKEGYLNGI